VDLSLDFVSSEIIKKKQPQSIGGTLSVEVIAQVPLNYNCATSVADYTTANVCREIVNRKCSCSGWKPTHLTSLNIRIWTPAFIASWYCANV